MEIKIKHQSEYTMHTFNVQDANKLTRAEIEMICNEMNVSAIFVNGKYYQN